MQNGENKDDWNTEVFRMFKGGSLWLPPKKNLYTAGMPDDIFEASLRDHKIMSSGSGDSSRGDKSSSESSKMKSSKSSSKTRESGGDKKSKKDNLTDTERDKFEDMLRTLLPDRNPLAETMVWCIEHAEAGSEVVDCIAESLSILQTPLTKKVARLYLISDILHNCSVKGVPNVSFYRKGFQVCRYNF